MVLTIHQPEYLPWLGFFDKVRQADVLVLLDTVPFRKNYYQNRNRILGKGGTVTLTVPVLTKGLSGQRINEVIINNENGFPWREKTWRSISQCYGRAPFWSEYSEALHVLFLQDWNQLSRLTTELIRILLRSLKIEVEVLLASDIDAQGSRTELLLNICQALGAETYLSGISGKDYLERHLFAKAGVQLRESNMCKPT